MSFDITETDRNNDRLYISRKGRFANHITTQGPSHQLTMSYAVNLVESFYGH
jgi:hypothetical protein